jgi:DNA-binding NarL/FixJ family response regulator
MTGRPKPIPPKAELDVAKAADLTREIRSLFGDLAPLLKARREAIRRARAKGATLQAIADRLDISRSAVANIEQ